MKINEKLLIFYFLKFLKKRGLQDGNDLVI